MSDTQTRRSTGEPAIGDERHILAESCTLDCCCDRKHLTHSRTTLRALVANDDHVVACELVIPEGVKGILFIIKYPGRTLEDVELDTGSLDNCALWSQ